ncbi:zinc finger, CCHC-type containing protein [Tanacetum coccineum]
MDFQEFYKELEAKFLGIGEKLMGIQLPQLELILWKNPSRSFRPVKSTEILWQFWASSSFRVSLAHDVPYGLGIAQVFAIGECHVPMESTIASRSTNVMMAATQTTNNNSIRSILDKEKLNGRNFLDWYCNLRIVLRNEQKLHYLEEALPEAPPVTATADVRNAYTRKELKTMFQQQAEQELFETVKAFHACKQEEGQSVSTYVLKMKAYLDQMERLVYPMPLVLRVNLILTSLLKDYDQQGQIQKPKSQARGKGKKRGKDKSKLAYDLKHKIPPPAKKEHPAKDTECHHCHKTRHWKRNYPLYLPELKENKVSTSGISCIFTIELFSFPKSNTWIYDTCCGTHICNTIYGLRGYQKLNKGALDLYVGNGNSAAVEAIGSFELILLTGMILVLDNCHFSPSITRGVISLSRLWDKGFHHKFIENGAISVSKDNIFYFSAFLCDGIFEIDMHIHISNERYIYTCSNMKTKHNLDSTFLWHCRLGHINKKCIAKLQHDGLLESINDEPFDICVSCISGKMARKLMIYLESYIVMYVDYLKPCLEKVLTNTLLLLMTSVDMVMFT